MRNIFAIHHLGIVLVLGACSKTATPTSNAGSSTSAVATNAPAPQPSLAPAAGKTELTDDSKQALHTRAEAQAKAAKSSADMASAVSLCGLAADLAGATDTACEALKPRYAAMMKREETARRAQEARDKAKGAAEEAAEKAKSARCEAAEQARNRCFANICLNLAADDPRNEACEEACTRRYQAPGCE